MVEFLIMVGAGVLFLVWGFLIWKKRKITLIHKYHYDKVAETDKEAFTSLVGKGAVIIGAGMVITGAVDLITNSAWGWIIFGVCFAVGFALMISAITKYNR